MKLKLIVPMLMLAVSALAQTNPPIAVTSDKVPAMLEADKKIVVLDVRTPGEFAQGHLKGAVNIDANSAGAMDQIGKLDKQAVYLVYCRTKNRSGYISNAMVQQGFVKIYQMTDGITGWRANGLPVVK